MNIYKYNNMYVDNLTKASGIVYKILEQKIKQKCFEPFKILFDIEQPDFSISQWAQDNMSIIRSQLYLKLNQFYDISYVYYSNVNIIQLQIKVNNEFNCILSKLPYNNAENQVLPSPGSALIIKDMTQKQFSEYYKTNHGLFSGCKVTHQQQGPYLYVYCK